MEKLQTLLIILFGLGAFIFRMIQKAREMAAKEAQERPKRRDTPAPALPNATFQELLKQMQARNAGENPAPNAPPVPAPFGERTPAGRPLPHEVAPPARSQERTEVRSRLLEAPATARPMSVPKPIARPNTGLSRRPVAPPMVRIPASETQPAEPINQTVRRLLARPADVRAAVVLSEILQRRHF